MFVRLQPSESTNSTSWEPWNFGDFELRVKRLYSLSEQRTVRQMTCNPRMNIHAACPIYRPVYLARWRADRPVCTIALKIPPLLHGGTFVLKSEIFSAPPVEAFFACPSAKNAITTRSATVVVLQLPSHPSSQTGWREVKAWGAVERRRA